MRKKNIVFYGFFAVAVIVSVIALSVASPDDKYLLHAPPPELPKPPLKELAEQRGLQIGNFASLKYLRERPYSELLESEFEQVIIDGEPNWQFEDHALRPSQDKYDFTDLDHVFDFADERDMPVRVQHLLWGEEKWLPNWLKQGDFTNQELMDIIKDHIYTVGERYKGKVREYTVVNEAFSRRLQKGGNRDWWGERLGQKYIDNAFLWARQADPEAILILNDFGNEYKSDISNLMYDYIKSARKRGIPIDGIGMQMHIDGASAKSKQEVVDNMRRFGELGVKVYITEFDVNMHGVHESKEKERQLQAQIYYDMVSACVEVGPDICPSFGFLGLTDRQSWYKGIGIKDAEPLMFTDDYKPKPAYFAVRGALTSQ